MRAGLPRAISLRSIDLHFVVGGKVKIFPLTSKAENWLVYNAPIFESLLAEDCVEVIKSDAERLIDRAHHDGLEMTIDFVS